MKIISLSYPDPELIPFEISKFPDGQQQIKIDYNKQNFWPVKISCRLNNFKDLELIICATKSLRNYGVKEIHLYTPYFLGSRSDRQFEEGSNNYLKQIICPIINGLNFESVTVIDPHSDVLEACLNNFKKESNLELVKTALSALCPVQVGLSKIILVSPDAGANKKIYKIADEIEYKGDILTCSKFRDNEGKLTQTDVPLNKIKDWSKNAVIIDDVLDGGKTFINIAEIFKKEGYSGKLYLVITHGIFSKGFGELQQYFDHIYTTNSYQDLLPDTKSYISQLNVF